jgi:hypothetical protein
MTDLHHVKNRSGLSALFPEEAHRYLAHTAEGRPLREIAREAGCHASTVLRQVRKLETLRDDPLVDHVLAAYGVEPCDDGPSREDLNAVTEAMRLLCQPGAMMLYRAGVERAAIIRTVGDSDTLVLGTVLLDVAAALILRNWIAPIGGYDLKRYRITDEGRSHLPKLVAGRDARAAEASDHMVQLFAKTGSSCHPRDRSQPVGPGADSPLTVLARRRGPDGKQFLSPDFVAAGDRLHEDFTIAGFTMSEMLGWERPDALQPLYDRTDAMTDRLRREASARTLDAVRDLGPGLSEVALRCCCLREGLEVTEKRLGWSARSGKVVLRIALQRLSLFYARTRAAGPVLIG